LRHGAGEVVAEPRGEVAERHSAGAAGDDQSMSWDHLFAETPPASPRQRDSLFEYEEPDSPQARPKRSQRGEQPHMHESPPESALQTTFLPSTYMGRAPPPASLFDTTYWPHGLPTTYMGRAPPPSAHMRQAAAAATPSGTVPTQQHIKACYCKCCSCYACRRARTSERGYDAASHADIWQECCDDDDMSAWDWSAYDADW
jgi:hypothetical protein